MTTKPDDETSETYGEAGGSQGGVPVLDAAPRSAWVLRGLYDKATDGGWFHERSDDECESGLFDGNWDLIGMMYKEYDAKYVVAMHANARRLIAALALAESMAMGYEGHACEGEACFVCRARKVVA